MDEDVARTIVGQIENVVRAVSEITGSAKLFSDPSLRRETIVHVANLIAHLNEEIAIPLANRFPAVDFWPRSVGLPGGGE